MTLAAAWLNWYVSQWKFTAADAVLRVHPEALEGLLPGALDGLHH